MGLNRIGFGIATGMVRRRLLALRIGKAFIEIDYAWYFMGYVVRGKLSCWLALSAFLFRVEKRMKSSTLADCLILVVIVHGSS